MTFFVFTCHYLLYIYVCCFFSSSVELSTTISKRLEDESCTVEPDPNTAQNYLIYIQNEESNGKILFGQLSYELCSYDNYLYTIIIGKKLYKVRSCDLKDRRLAIVDNIEQNNNNNSDQYSTIQCPETLFQVIDSFSKSNKTYHVTINDKENPLGYLAITILLDLHECQRSWSKIKIYVLHYFYIEN